MHPPTAHGSSLPSYWQRVRAYAVPPSMIETATARRRAGDWAGACAAAHVDVDLRPRALARSHGRDLADRVRADLARLAPDPPCRGSTPDGCRTPWTSPGARCAASSPPAPPLVHRLPADEARRGGARPSPRSCARGDDRAGGRRRMRAPHGPAPQGPGPVTRTAQPGAHRPTPRTTVGTVAPPGSLRRAARWWSKARRSAARGEMQVQGLPNAPTTPR